MLAMYFYILDADSVLFHRTSSVGPCLSDPGHKGLAFSTCVYPPLYTFYIYHFTINIFDNQTYFDMQQSHRRRIWVNIFLHVLIVDE